MGYRFCGARASLWAADANRGSERADASASSVADVNETSPDVSHRTTPASGSSIFTRRRLNLRLMTTIRVKENEPFDVALRRFKRTIEKLGLLTELRAREFYEKPTAERKRKKAAAVKRHYKRVRSMQLPKKLY